MKHVAILGCGPAGLLAAHACTINGVHFNIYSKKRPSTLYGAQYLHDPVMGITGDPVSVTYDLNGTADAYRDKVYPGRYDVEVSPSSLQGEHLGWDIRAAYRRLWARYEDSIHETNIQADFANWDGLAEYDLILSTVPRTIWKQPGDDFRQEQVWAVGDAPDLGQVAPFTLAQDNLVLCDGTDDVSWYRISKVFGHTSIEWPGHKRPPVEGIAPVVKPISATTSLTPEDKWRHLGRYGKWQKGVLTTDAFHEALTFTSV